MRQLYTMVSSAVRLLGISIAFCALSGQAQAEAQNSISALSVSTGNGMTVIKVELDATTGKSSGRVYHQYPAAYCV